MKSLLCLLLGVGLLASPAALAAPQKGPQKAPAAANKKKAPEKPEGPADMSSFSGDIDESPEWFRKTDDAIAQLTDLVKSLPEGDVKATRMIQLAELYWQKSSRLHLRAVREHNKKYDDWFLKDGAAKGIPEPKLSAQPAEKESDEVMQKAVKIYEHVIKKYPNTSRGDQAHFYLGQSYLSLTKKDQALATFKKLVERYPQSELIPDAYLALGEFFFENKKVDDALENYTKAAKYPNYKNRPYAIYKLAWCYANKSDYRKALQLAQEVVKASMESKLEYGEQALKDMINWYTEVGDVEGAETYFRSVGGGETFFRKFLEIFAARLFEQGRDDESIRVYKRLIALDPMHSENLTYEGEILKAWIRKADRNAVLAQLDRIVNMVQDDSAWAQKNRSQQEEIKRQRDSLEGTVSKYAREVWEESKKLSAEQKYRGLEQTEKFCSYYLRTFPATARNTYAIRMMLGEAQYALGQMTKDPKVKEQKFAAAMDTYIKEVEADPKGEFLALAAENAIFAAEEIVKVRKPSPRPDAKDKTPREIPGPEANVIRASDVYVKHVPKGPKIVASRYKAAYLFYEFNQFDEALKRFADVIQMHPNTPQARFAADLTLDVFNLRNDPQSVNAYAKNYLKIQPLVSQKDDDGVEYRKTLQGVAERSSYKICEQVVESKKHSDAAACFGGFVKEYPASDLADEAYYSMSVAFFEAGEVDKAIGVREDFIKRYPTHERTPEVISYLASNYRKVTDFDRAADYFEMLATKFPKYGGQKDDGSVACAGLYNAAFFRENLGETQKAIANYRQYMKQCSTAEDVHEVLYAIALLYERRKDDANAIKTFDEYIKTYGARKSPDFYLEAQVKIADLTYGNGKKKEAYAKYQGVIDSYRNLVKQKAKIGTSGLGAAAKSAFYVIEPKYDEYNSIKLDNKKTLAANIKKRLTMIKPLRDSYEKVVLDYKHGEWAVAALYQIGKMSDDFVAAVKSSPMPEELKTEAQKELYLYELGEQFRPVEEAAIEYYAKCVRTSAEYRIYNEFTRKSIASLERLRPSQFVADQEFRLEAGPNVAMFESSPIVEVK